jgi:DNA-directed RNA polymerase subunit K/omega
VYRGDVPNAFEFIVVAALRVRQLVRGSLPRVTGAHKKTRIAQDEVLAGKVGKAEVPSTEAPVASPRERQSV